MKHLRGTIKEGDKVILENLEIMLTGIKPPLGLQEWRGTFKLQEFRYFEPGQQYTTGFRRWAIRSNYNQR